MTSTDAKTFHSWRVNLLTIKKEYKGRHISEDAFSGILPREAIAARLDTFKVSQLSILFQSYQRSAQEIINGSVFLMRQETEVRRETELL